MAITVPTPADRLCPVTKMNLDRVKKYRLDREYDYVIVVVADKSGVGEGKSTLEHLICAYINPERFTINHVIWDGADYDMLKPSLRPKDSIGFDEPDAFLSSEASTRQQRKVRMSFTKIRQKCYFIVICSPTLLLLQKWFRGVGVSRVNCILRVTRRGKFLAYTDKTGSIDKIRIDTRKNLIVWPKSDFTGYFKSIPKKSPWWIEYSKRKDDNEKRTDTNPYVTKLMKKQMKKMHDSLTVMDVVDIYKVNKATVKQWIRLGFFGKRGVFIGVDGRRRIKKKVFKRGMKRVALWKERNVKLKQKLAAQRRKKKELRRRARTKKSNTRSKTKKKRV